MIPKSLQKRAELFPQLRTQRNNPSTTHVLGPVSYRNGNVIRHDNHPARVYSSTNTYNNHYDELRNRAIAGDANAIRDLTNLALSI